MGKEKTEEARTKLANIKRVFATKFKTAMKSKNLTVDQVTEMLGLENKKAVEKWRNENLPSGTFPAMEKFPDICNLLDCDMNYLLMEDESHFNKGYENASEITGLSDQALRTISNIQNDIEEDKNGTPIKNVFKKNMLDYLLANHPEFIDQFLDLIYGMLISDSESRFLQREYEYIPSLAENHKRMIQENTDMQMVRITRLLQNLIRDYDRNSFRDDIGYSEYLNDHISRSKSINDIFNGKGNENLKELNNLEKDNSYDINTIPDEIYLKNVPEDLRPYYKGTKR